MHHNLNEIAIIFKFFWIKTSFIIYLSIPNTYLNLKNILLEVYFINFELGFGT